jgi:hypothetical protein
VKDLIRKILRESGQIPDDAPEWVKRFHKLPKEDRIQDIENRKDKIEKLMPNIINFFEDRFGDELEKIVIDQKKVHYGTENHSSDRWVINFYFFPMFPRNKYYNEIVKDLINFFNIDISWYGMPLNIEIHDKKREKP